MDSQSSQKLEQVQKKLHEANIQKEKGNAFFKQKQYIKALRCYHNSNLYLTGLIDKQSPMVAYSNKKDILDQETSKRVSQLKFSVYMNMGQIYLYQNKFDKAKDILTKAAAIKQNTKLKYRQAICQMNLGQYERSKILFNQVLRQDASTKPQVQQNLLRIKQLQKRADQKSKKMFSKFFQS